MKAAHRGRGGGMCLYIPVSLWRDVLYSEVQRESERGERESDRGRGSREGDSCWRLLRSNFSLNVVWC